jgi:energy-coupling factor transport system permease protein
MPKIRNTLKNRIRNILPTLTSALVVTLRNIPALSMSLEARGFGSAVKRTQYHDLSAYRHPFRDTIAFGVVFIVLFIASKK